MFTFVNMEDRIKEWFRKIDLTQYELSQRLDVSKGAISHILSGRNKPSLEFIQNLKKAFPEISLDWLIIGEGEMNISNGQNAKIEVDAELQKILYTAEQAHREIIYQLSEINKKMRN